MSRVVLVAHPDREMRAFLGRSLAGKGYEAVQAATESEGVMLAEGLELAMVIATHEMPAFAAGEMLTKIRKDPQDRCALLLLGKDDAGASAAAEGLYSLPVEGVDRNVLATRIRTLLVAREVGLEADRELGSLVGELALLPLLELLRALHRASVSGVLEMDQGWVALERGEVIAAASGAAGGSKAFFRLARSAEGPIRLTLGSPEADVEIVESFTDLITTAIEACLGDRPANQVRVQVEVGPALFKHAFTNRQRRILTLAHRTVTVEDLIDAMPDPDHQILDDLLVLQGAGVATLVEPESEVQIVTDSTADLPGELARRHGIRVVPLHVDFGERSYLDGVDLGPRRFFDLLDSSEESPATRPPSSEDFAAVYGEVARQRNILSLHISTILSDTAIHARQAAETLAAEDRSGDRVVEVVDTRSVSLGLGMLALFAARMARRGFTLPEIRSLVERLSGGVTAMFVVDSLEYLVRGGRLSRSRGFIGSLLGIKPILAVEEGEIVARSKVRRFGPAQKKLTELLSEGFSPSRPIVASIVHARAPLQADRMRELLTAGYNIRELLVSDIGPVVGTHVGPGTVGAAIVQPEDDDWAAIEPLT